MLTTMDTTQLVKLKERINPLNAELNPLCHLLALLRAHRILHVSWIGVKQRYINLLYTHHTLILKNLASYI
jgi:hypothetical protein